MPIYTVSSLDVWGNAIDGYTVNDQFRQGEVYLQPGEDERGTVLALMRDGYLSDAAEALFASGELQIGDDSGEGHIELVELQEEEFDEEGEPVAGSMPILHLDENRLSYDEGLPFWRTLERFESKRSGPHLLDVVARYWDDTARTHNPILSFEVTARSAPGAERGPHNISDKFQFFLEDWAKERKTPLAPFFVGSKFVGDKKAGRVGFDPWTSDEVFLDTAQVQDLLIALDKFLETEEPIEVEPKTRLIAQNHGPQSGYAYEAFQRQGESLDELEWSIGVVDREDFGEEFGVVVVDGQEMRVWKARPS